MQGISVDMDEEFDPVACAEQAQQDRQRELEIEYVSHPRPIATCQLHAPRNAAVSVLYTEKGLDMLCQKDIT